MKEWIVPPQNPDLAQRLSRALKVSPVTSRILVARGFDDPAATSEFLEPTLNQLVDPCADPAVSGAVDHIGETMGAGKRLAIFGDFDADGICSTTLLLKCLRLAGGDVEFYIPHRCAEGYGLNAEALRELASNDIDTVITVDCGVSAVEETRLARELGLEVIVTDHHEPGEHQVDVDFVLNPKLPECNLGSDKLCGAGVAFKLAWAIGQRLSPGTRVSDEFREFLLEAMSLVAIGTVADMVPLVGENRVLTKFGLKALAHSATPGLQALKEAADVKDSPTSFDIGYRLAPRLNAVGRIGHAEVAVELLTTDDKARAEELADHLDEENKRRRSIQRAAVAEAEERVEETVDLEETRCIVLSDEEWHRGVVGLVASRLAEKFWKPAFVFAVEDGMASGSARSIPGFHLFNAVDRCGELLENYGGHEGAAGLTLRHERLEEFTGLINEIAAEAIDESAVPTLEVDAEVELRELNTACVKELQVLAPFGEGNPRPVLIARDVTLAGNPQLVGSRGNHLTFLAKQGKTAFRAIAFNGADWLQDMKQNDGQPFSVAFQPRIDTYNRYNSVELKIKDIRWDDETADERR